jgi:hypothetical protein
MVYIEALDPHYTARFQWRTPIVTVIGHHVLAGGPLFSIQAVCYVFISLHLK